MELHHRGVPVTLGLLLTELDLFGCAAGSQTSGMEL